MQLITYQTAAILVCLWIAVSLILIYQAYKNAKPMEPIKQYELNGRRAFHECRGVEQHADPQTKIELYRNRFWYGWRKERLKYEANNINQTNQQT